LAFIPIRLSRTDLPFFSYSFFSFFFCFPFFLRILPSSLGVMGCYFNVHPPRFFSPNQLARPLIRSTPGFSHYFPTSSISSFLVRLVTLFPMAFSPDWSETIFLILSPPPPHYFFFLPFSFLIICPPDAFLNFPVFYLFSRAPCPPYFFSFWVSATYFFLCQNVPKAIPSRTLSCPAPPPLSPIACGAPIFFVFH